MGVCSFAVAQDVYLGGRGVTRRGTNALTGDLTLEGTVVNSVTGEAIPRALVQLMSPSDQVAMTDSQGRFRFSNLPAVQVMVVARKPGYFMPGEAGAGGPRMSPPLPLTADTKPITIKLIPAGVVTGHVTNEDGEPVEGARVRLRERFILNGHQRWRDRSGAASDEDGVFRVGGVAPGSYLVAFEPPMRGMPATPGEDGFVLSYYPGVDDESAASLVDVRPGSTTEIQMALRRAPLYRISGVVTNPGRGRAFVQLLRKSGEPFSAMGGQMGAGGSFAVPRVPAGSYVLVVRAQNPDGMLVARTDLTVADNISDLQLRLQPGISIPVEVRADVTSDNSAQPQGFIGSFGGGGNIRDRYQVGVRLTPVEQGRGEYGASFEGPPENRTFVIRNLEPGRYSAHFTAMGNNYVASATWGTVDLLHDDLVVTGSGDTQPIQILLKNDTASLSGTVTGGSAQNLQVLLLADGVRGIEPRVLYTGGQTGTFQVTGLAPGSYHVYAFDQLDGVEYANPEAMKPFRSKSAAVTLSPGQKATVQVELIKRAEE